MLNIALVGAWHVHFGQHADEAAARKDCRITALWDDDPVRGKEAAAHYSCDFEPDYDALLARPDVDAVVVCSATNQHTQLLIKAANAKKHIFTEKVLCLTVEDAKRIRQAVEEAGIRFCIAFFWRSHGDMQYAKSLVDSGALGQITYARMRNPHDGAIAGWLPPHFYDPVQCGGGAMIDLGTHPMYLLAWLLGMPAYVSSVFTAVTGHPVEDNAVSVLEYKNGAIAVSRLFRDLRHQGEPFPGRPGGETACEHRQRLGSAPGARRPEDSFRLLGGRHSDRKRHPLRH